MKGTYSGVQAVTFVVLDHVLEHIWTYVAQFTEAVVQKEEP